MASKYLPKTAIKVPPQQFHALVNFMGGILVDDPNRNSDPEYRLLYALNLAIYREWLDMQEREGIRKNYKCTFDMAQALAFHQYWKIWALPTYESVAFNLIFKELDKSLNDQRFKKIVL